MKALNLHAIADLRYEDVPMPMRHKGEVLLKIQAVGICGSDIPRVFIKGTYHFPTIIGHEFAGEIVEAEDDSIIGRGVAVIPLLPCGQCEACQEEHYAQCSQYDYYGSRRNGAMTEYLAVKQDNICFMPEGISYEEAAMCEPAAVALHAFHKCSVEAGSTILIYGIGPIALILAQWARAAGVKNIVLVGRTEDKVEFARTLGFSLAVNVKQDNLEELIQEITFGRGVDACIEGTGESRALETCILNTKNYGTIVSMGNPVGDMRLSQDVYWRILRKELSIVGTWNSSFSQKKNEWKDTLLAMQDGRLNLKPLITHRFLLAEYEKAFALMHERLEMYCKVMFVKRL
ncbi:galactitol-1-phosphate 5-dehydrogenase [Selenomonas ruminantium]|uniref:galactitol-1-phosphate 5-dehydrogenase n=1 Tax=Selenomonas ruminantium TaxID=971 RepID=UPI000429F1D7|nr:galactitol-1-phosphate 5-dehydrogenase [Selenomonas ruminantium]